MKTFSFEVFVTLSVAAGQDIAPHALFTLFVVWPSQSVFATAKRFNYIFNPEGQEVNSVETEIHSPTHLYHLDQRVTLFSVFCISSIKLE